MNRILKLIICRRFSNEYLFAGIGLAASLFIILALMGRCFWTFELIANFIPQYLVFLTIALGGMIYYKNWKLATVFVPFLLICLIKIIPLYLPCSNYDKTAKPSYKILSCNILASNKDKTIFENLIKTENPDFIVITEYTDKWQYLSETILKDYKIKVMEPHTDNYGIALFGRFDGDVTMLRTQDDYGLALHHIDFKMPGGKKLRLMGMHSLVPMNRILHDARNRSMKKAAEICRQANGPAILTGDFNQSVFSAYYKEVLEVGNFYNASEGEGLAFTWPTWKFWPIKIFSMQIDHCLLTKDIKLVSWKRGADTGSDHLPLIIEFSL